MKFLLMGYGSIGHKHKEILTQGLGHKVDTVDPDPDKGADYQEIVEDLVKGYDGILDCTPPDVRPWWMYGYFAPLFIEKPLGKMPFSTMVLAMSPPPNWTTMMGFCYRWDFTLEDFVAKVQEKGICELHIRGGQYLQNWHKEDYQTVPERYHGVVTDSLPHSIFIAQWILGKVYFEGATYTDVGGLGLEVEDTAGVLLSGPAGQPVMLSANYIQNVRAFTIEALCKDREIERWSFSADRAGVMYFRQMDNFCKLCKMEDIGYYPTLQDGVAVQEILDAIKS